MEFLKEILGDELYAKVETAVNAYNSDEANKEKPLKLANLSSGEYVGTGKYEALNTQLTGKNTELEEANKLIAELKKAGKSDEELQTKIQTYETSIAGLQEKLAEEKLNSAVKIALLSENVTDVDYVAYKLQEKLKATDEKLELDGNDNIKGWESKISELKTQLPTMFGSSSRKIDEKKLPDDDVDHETEPKSLAEALQMQYESNGE